MKIIGIIMILVGIFSIFYAGQGSKKGRIVEYRGDGGPGWELRKGDPKFDEEIRSGFIGGAVMIGLGIVFLCIPKSDNEEDES